MKNKAVAPTYYLHLHMMTLVRLKAPWSLHKAVPACCTLDHQQLGTRYKVQAKLRNVTDARINVAGYQICILAMFIMRPVIQGTA